MRVTLGRVSPPVLNMGRAARDPGGRKVEPISKGTRAPQGRTRHLMSPRGRPPFRDKQSVGEGGTGNAPGSGKGTVRGLCVGVGICVRLCVKLFVCLCESARLYKRVRLCLCMHLCECVVSVCDCV